MGSVRHLTYFVCPLNDVAVWNLDYLRRYMSLFNGSRTIAIADTGRPGVVEGVQHHLRDCGVDWIVVRNDTRLREMQAFPQLVAAASRWQGSGDVTFYGHAKGVSSQSWAPGVVAWTSAMYDGLLGHWPHVRRLLQQSPAVGCFLRTNCGLPESSVAWHYSGSFRWVRNRDLYARDWRRIDPGWCGSEGHVALHFTREEAACLFGAFAKSGLGLYLLETWDQWASAEVARYEEEHMADRYNPLLCTVVICSHRKPEYVHQAIESVRRQTTCDWQLVVIDSGPLLAAGEFGRYRDDARIAVIPSEETEELRARVAIQSWCHNRVICSTLCRGDLIAFLSDDDVYAPWAVQQWLEAARQRPEQSAWYAPVDRVDVNAQGVERPYDVLPAPRVAGPDFSLDMRADGMQCCVRRSHCPLWPEAREEAYHADGLWLAAVGASTPIHPLPRSCGRHRITPISTFTRRLPGI